MRKLVSMGLLLCGIAGIVAAKGKPAESRDDRGLWNSGNVDRGRDRGQLKSSAMGKAVGPQEDRGIWNSANADRGRDRGQLESSAMGKTVGPQEDRGIWNSANANGKALGRQDDRGIWNSANANQGRGHAQLDSAPEIDGRFGLSVVALLSGAAIMVRSGRQRRRSVS